MKGALIYSSTVYYDELGSMTGLIAWPFVMGREVLVPQVEAVRLADWLRGMVRAAWASEESWGWPRASS